MCIPTRTQSTHSHAGTGKTNQTKETHIHCLGKVSAGNFRSFRAKTWFSQETQSTHNHAKNLTGKTMGRTDSQSHQFNKTHGRCRTKVSGRFLDVSQPEFGSSRNSEHAQLREERVKRWVGLIHSLSVSSNQRNSSLLPCQSLQNEFSKFQNQNLDSHVKNGEMGLIDSVSSHQRVSRSLSC